VTEGGDEGNLDGLNVYFGSSSGFDAVNSCGTFSPDPTKNDASVSECPLSIAS